MTHLVRQAIYERIRFAVFEVHEHIELIVIRRLCVHPIRVLAEHVHYLLHGRTVLLKRVDKLHKERLLRHIVTHINRRLRVHVQAEPLALVSHSAGTQSIFSVIKETLKRLLHAIDVTVCAHHMVESAQRVIQPSAVLAETELNVLFFDHIAYILFQFFVIWLHVSFGNSPTLSAFSVSLLPALLQNS